nr:uncharacterized protein LOC109154352 isoform X2 [Ipomoea batatas]
MVATNGKIPRNEAATYGEVLREETHCKNPREDIQLQILEEIQVGELGSVLLQDANEDSKLPIEYIGLHGIKFDKIEGDGMKIISRGVKISCDQHPKRRKTITHASKGKQVVESTTQTNAKTHKSLGMTKSIE